MVERIDKPADDENVPDFLTLLQDDPWLEVSWRRALGAMAREHNSLSGGGADSPGGRFAYRLNAQQRIRNAIRAPQAGSANAV